MIGAGLAYSVPLPLPFSLRPYLDFAAYPAFNTGRTKVESAWAAGVAAVIVPDIFEIYFPIASNNINYSKRDKYGQKISFLLNINKLQPYEALRNMKLNL
jgi:hypothetical protein